MGLTKTQKETLRTIFEKFDLTKDDIFTHNHFVIITRTGIEKIQANLNIHVEYEEILVSIDEVVIKAKATYLHRVEDIVTEHEIYTYGEASPKNCKNAYFWATAEKRALSRAVLKCVGLYKLGVFGEDEDVS